MQNTDTCIETHHEAHLLQQRAQVPLQDPEVALAGHVPAVNLFAGQRLDLVRRQFAVFLRPEDCMHAELSACTPASDANQVYTSAMASCHHCWGSCCISFMAACTPVLCAGVRMEARSAASHAQLPVNFVQPAADVGAELAAVTCQQLHLCARVTARFAQLVSVDLRCMTTRRIAHSGTKACIIHSKHHSTRSMKGCGAPYSSMKSFIGTCMCSVHTSEQHSRGSLRLIHVTKVAGNEAEDWRGWRRHLLAMAGNG